METVQKKAVTAQLLTPLERPLSQRLGCEARLALIPYCQEEREQVDLLRIMAGYVAKGATVHIDISHGFRHLPMLALLAALHLQVVRQPEIAGLWYGAFDPDTNQAAVHNLTGLLRITEWIEALHTYDKDGDYGVFAPLLGPTGDLLRRAAFFERTSNPVKPREALSGWASRGERFPANDPAAELFRDELEQRLDWYRKPDRAAWERELALRYLEQGDYVRAAIYGLESVISAEVIRSDGIVNDFECRYATRKKLQSGREGFRTLSNIRNALAHGVRPRDRNIERALAKETNLRNTLKSLLT